MELTISPKMSIFYGEEGKGDVTWNTFKYEIIALLCENVFTHEHISLGIRRACREQAGDSFADWVPIYNLLKSF